MKSLNRLSLIAGIFTVLLLGSMTTSAAPYWNWLDTTPASKFNDDDWKLLQTAARDLLNNGKDGEMREWENPETGNSGKMKLISSSDAGGTKCRKVAIRNVASFHGLSGQQVRRLCLQDDGKWKVAE